MAAIGAIGAIARTPSRYVRAAGAGVALSAVSAILPITMRGSNLLLAHLEAVARLTAADPSRDRRPSARTRLERKLGPELSRTLLPPRRPGARR
jgi:hypothetical protein